MQQLPELEELHKLQLSMIKDVDALCRKHDIKYFLICGTLLGAVRHNGFIPWDDDVDIGFLRPDYDRFIELAQAELNPKYYYVQKEFTKEWPFTYSKLRRNGTTYIEYDVFDSTVHQGVFLDLFPIDNLSSGKIGRSVQWLAYKIIANKSSEVLKLKRSPFKRAVHFMCMFAPVTPLLSFVIRKRDEKSSRVHMFLGSAGIKAHNEFYREDFETSVDHQFEGYSFSIPKGWDRVLRTEFKEYWNVPPVETRLANIHAKYCDINTDYRVFLREKGMDKNA